MPISHRLFYDIFLCRLVVDTPKKPRTKKEMETNQNEQHLPKAYGLDFTAITLDPDGVVNASASRD